MPKKLLPLFQHSAERIQRVGAVPPKLTPFEKEAIITLGNRVNGRDFTIAYTEKILTEMYPNLASRTPQNVPETAPVYTSAEVTTISTSPNTTSLAPEVAPPPIIQEALKPTADNVVSLHDYRTQKASSPEAPQIVQSPNTQVDEKAEQVDMLARARAEIEEIYDQGENSRFREAA